MSFYGDLATTARNLIAAYGQAVTITRDPDVEIDPVTGEETGSDPQTFSPQGVLRTFPDMLIDETRIKSSDRELILDDTVAPEMDDLVTIDGEDWTIVRITGTKPAGTPLIWRVQVRR